jgi:hypothetical protein
MHENRRYKKVEFLREYKPEFKKSEAFESGSQGGLFDEKTEGLKKLYERRPTSTRIGLN